MTTEEILANISRLKGDLRKDAAPHDISAACAGLSIYLTELNDTIYDLEQSYKLGRADKYVELIEEGKSPNAAEIELNQDKDLIRDKIQTEKLKALTKRLDVVISAHQSYLRMLDSTNKGNL